jgi:ribose 5-phosphate isomerase A
MRAKADGSPFVTDNGNQILDCSFGKIEDPPALARILSDTPGVVEHGLFIGLATIAIVGKGTAVEEIGTKRFRQKRVRTKRQRRKRQ